MVLLLVAQQDAETLVQEVAVRIIHDAALQKIASQPDVLTAGPFAKGLTLKFRVLKR